MVEAEYVLLTLSLLVAFALEENWNCVELADSMPDGWRIWLEWQAVVAPKNLVEIRAIEADAGDYMGYVRVAGRRRKDAKVDAIIQSIPTTYVPQPLLRANRTRTMR